MSKSTLVLALTTLFFSSILQAQWEQRYYFPSSKNPAALSASFESGSIGMASCYIIDTSPGSIHRQDSGAIILTRNKGLQWTHSLVLEDVMFFDIVNTTAGVYFGYGNHDLSYGIFAKTFDYGQYWDTTHFQDRIFSVSFPSDSVGYLLADSLKFFRTTDSAKTWQQIARLPYSVADIHFITDSVGFLFSNGNSLYRTTDAGISWTRYSFPQPYIIDFSFVKGTSTAYLLLKGSQDTLYIYKSINHGVTWNQVGRFGYSRGYPGTLEFTTEDTSYISGQFMMYKTIDGGRSWFRQKDNTNSNFHDYVSDIECLSSDTCYAVGFQLFYRTFNGGDTILASGIGEMSQLKHKLKLYPNPMNEQFYVAYSGEEQLQFQLYNLMGQKVEAAVQQEGNRYRFSVGHLPKGVYLLEVLGREERASFRLVKE